jgi:hypothetical protein
LDHKSIIEARKRAESAVDGMADAALKVKAFEQVFARLLDEIGTDQRRAGRQRKVPDQTATRSAPGRKGTLTARLLSLREDGFFGTQRSLSDVREELGSRGFHYPLTTLSGAMQKLVRNRELRRDRVKSGAKKTYKYANA